MKEIENAREIQRAREGFCWFLIGLIWVCFLFGSSRSEGAENDFRFTSPCDGCFSYFDPVKRTWNGQVQILLNPENRPDWASIDDIEQSIQKNLDYIKQYADIPLVYGGRTNLTHIEGYDSTRENTIVWNFKDIPNAGYTHIWWNWKGANAVNYGEVSLRHTLAEKCLDGIGLHELLHTLYIQHNVDTQHSIMAATPYNSCEYQATLRLDDIVALQSLYAPMPNRGAVVTPLGCLYVPEVMFEGQSIQATICDPSYTLEVELIPNP